MSPANGQSRSGWSSERAARLARQLIALLGPAAAAAVAYTLACPPYDLWLLAWAAPALLLVPARRLSTARAALSGIVFGVLIGAGITHWALEASLAYFDFNRVAAAGFVLFVWLLCSGLPYGLLAAAYAMAAKRVPRALAPLVGAWLWVVCELLRANPWTGMPWELLAHTQWQNLPLLQVADLGGMYAVSFVVALVSLSIGELLAERRREVLVPRMSLRRLALPAALLVTVLLYGEYSLSLAATSDGASRRVAVVQASVPSSFHWKRAFVDRVLTAYARLTDDAGVGPERPDLVVWPENAVGFYLDGEPLLRAQIGEVAARFGGDLVVGAPRLGDGGSAHNSAYVIGPDGTIQGTYDKRRLVPFAEYDPFPARAEAADSASLAYASGRSAGILDAGGLRLGAVICYEVLFPELVRAAVRDGAEVLINLSNDSWLDAGDDSGAAPRQHLSMAVFRAIENRRFLIRAATTGISGFVTPYGETIALLPIGASAATMATIAPRRQQTVYLRFGEAWVLVLGLGVACALRVSRDGRPA